jgi:hypothetical protein
VKRWTSLEAAVETASSEALAALKVPRPLNDLETYVCGQSDIIIDYAIAWRRKEPISTAITESTVQWLLHHRMNAQQQMRWTPRGAYLMLEARSAVMNGTLEQDHGVSEKSANRPNRCAACPPGVRRSQSKVLRALVGRICSFLAKATCAVSG